MIIKTEAIVLKTRRYSESSKIAVLYTRERGKLSALAKGALRGKGRFGASLEPMSHVSAVLYVKAQRDLQILSECDLFRPFRTLMGDAEKMAAGLACVELTDAVTHEEERSDALFALLLKVLAGVDAVTKRAGNTLYYYEMGLLEVLGFKPFLHSCAGCGGNIEVGDREAGEVRISGGGVLCSGCARRQGSLVEVSRPAFRILQRLQEVDDPAVVTRWVLPAGVAAEVATTLRRLLEFHIEGLRPLRSQRVFSAFPV